MDWMVPLSSLNADQEEIRDTYLRTGRRSMWIRGPVGSGKTVLLVHCALAEASANPRSKIAILGYTHALVDLVRSGFHNREMSQVRFRTHTEFLSESGDHDVVFVDEVQDIPMNDLLSIRRRAGRLVVAGDHHQAIYENGASEDEIRDAFDAEEVSLRIVERLGRPLIKLAARVAPDSGIEAAPSGSGAEESPIVVRASDWREEWEAAWLGARSMASVGSPVALLLPTHKAIAAFVRLVCEMESVDAPPKLEWMFIAQGRRWDYSPWNDHLATAGIPLQYLGNGFGSLEASDRQPLVYLMTYHSAKGLDFKTVFLPCMSDGVRLWRDDEALHRALLYVGVTRTRLTLVVFCCEQGGYPGVSAEERDWAIILNGTTESAREEQRSVLGGGLDLNLLSELRGGDYMVKSASAFVEDFAGPSADEDREEDDGFFF